MCCCSHVSMHLYSSSLLAFSAYNYEVHFLGRTPSIRYLANRNGHFRCGGRRIGGRLAADVHLCGCCNPSEKLVNVQERIYIILDTAVPQGCRACRAFSLITVQGTRPLVGRMEGVFTRRMFPFGLAKTSARARESQLG